MKPFAASADSNKDVILSVIKPLLEDAERVLEIGSGTGQHAVHFAREMPTLSWQTSELEPNHAGIQAWLDEAALDNVLRPVVLNVDDDSWPVCGFDAVYTANTFHIMSWRSVCHLFAGVGRVLNPGGLLMVYGPFNYGGRYTSESNARFDQSLRARDPLSGIRDFEQLDELAHSVNMSLHSDNQMPVNNRLLVWRRT